jgi:hypothetical protein
VAATPHRVLVVFESMFGLTAQVAEAVAEGVRDAGGVAHVVAAGDLDAGTAGDGHLDDVDLLVVGAPTHAHGLSRGPTRWMAAMTASHTAGVAMVHHGRSLRSVLRHLADGHGRPAAAFDTRVDGPEAGEAAASIEERLRDHGWLVQEPSLHAVVDGLTGPLAADALTRARAWGRELTRHTAPV